MSIQSRCKQMQAAIRTAKAAGQPIPDFGEELAAMEAWLRDNRLWKHDQDGFPCPWVDHCRCTHRGCRDGWLNEETPGRTVRGLDSEAPARRCPECDRARLLVEHSRKTRNARMAS